MITREEYFNQLKKKIIAVDFDGTISIYNGDKYHLDNKAKKYLTKLHKKGYRLVLWSARLTEPYDRAYNRCVNEFGLDFIERDDGELIHGHSGKLVANYYIDDMSSYGKVNWRKTYKYIVSHIK